MEQAEMETILGALPGIEPGALRTRLKDLKTVPRCQYSASCIIADCSFIILEGYYMYSQLSFYTA